MQGSGSRLSEIIRCLEFQVSLGVKSSCVTSLNMANIELSAVMAEIDKVSEICTFKNLTLNKNETVLNTELPQETKIRKSKFCDEELIKQIRAELENIKCLEELRDYVLKFELCSLKLGCRNTVFSDGNQSSKIMLFGEAPGEQEDIQARPFCGKSGLLLDEVLSSIDFFRKDNIYITNSVFWRPPGNRKPTEEEVEICRPIIEKHISLINPKLIIVCGATAVESVLQKTGITKIVGSFFDYSNQYLDESIKAVPIFHPAFLLRNPAAKSIVWGNMLKLKKYCIENNIY